MRAARRLRAGGVVKAGMSVPAAAIVGVPLAMGVVAHVVHRLRTPAREVVPA